MSIPAEHQEAATAFFGRQMQRDMLLSKSQSLAVDFLIDCIRRQQPLAALAGGAGCGKTVALNAALTALEGSGHRVTRVANFSGGPLSMHRMIAASLGVVHAGDLSAEEIDIALGPVLTERAQARPPVLALDDAHLLLPETLRYLCMLAGLRDNGQPRFCILLSGHSGFADRHAVPLQFAMQAAEPDDATRLLRHEFAAVGAEVSDETMQDLVGHAGGNLRVLDSLLRHRVEEDRRASISRNQSGPGQSVAPADSSRFEKRQRFVGPWPGFAVCVALGAASAALTFHYGLLSRHEKPIALALVSPAAIPSDKATSKLAGLKPEPTAVMPSAPKPTTTKIATAPVALPPTRAVTPPPPATTPMPAPAIVPEPVELRAPPPPPAPLPTRFRVYNVESYRNGVCSRCKVYDLSRNKPLTISVDLSALEPGAAATLRSHPGAVDFFVSGFIETDSSAGQKLVAKRLLSVPRRQQPPAVPAKQSPDQPVPAASPVWSTLLGSPPVGPQSSSPRTDAASSPADPRQAEAPSVMLPPNRSPAPGFLTFPDEKPADASIGDSRMPPESTDATTSLMHQHLENLPSHAAQPSDSGTKANDQAAAPATSTPLQAQPEPPSSDDWTSDSPGAPASPNRTQPAHGPTPAATNSAPPS